MFVISNNFLENIIQSNKLWFTLYYLKYIETKDNNFRYIIFICSAYNDRFPQKNNVNEFSRTLPLLCLPHISSHKRHKLGLRSLSVHYPYPQ